MSWLNASEYVVIEVTARDRVAELHAATDARNCPDPAPAACRSAEAGDAAADAWRCRSIGADRRFARATVRRRLGACAS
jgi:hypothetical protein